MLKTLSGIPVRYFGPRKELFYLAGLHALPTDARDQAETLRNGGFNARRIETTTCSQVWVSRWVRGAENLPVNYKKLTKLSWYEAHKVLLEEDVQRPIHR